MKREISDEQFDSLMRVIVTDAAADDALIDEVAGSPAVWWGIQRQINQQNEAGGALSSFLGLWRLLAIGLPVAAVILVASFFILRPARNSVDLAGNQRPAIVQNVQPPITDGIEQATVVPKTGIGSEPAALRSKKSKTTSATLAALAKPSNTTSATVTKKATEIKTEFIALSYARNPESGQIVRIKVPSSMMVTLGLVATVEKLSALVDAEVIVGDDGLTRAIRFIH